MVMAAPAYPQNDNYRKEDIMNNKNDLIAEGRRRKWEIPFDPERPIPFVKHCGRTFSDITDRNELYRLSCELSDTEKSSAFAKYFNLGPAMPCEENIRATEYQQPIAPSEGFMIEDFVNHMDVDGCNPLKTGYCILSNGVGFGTATTLMPGCTAEIMTHFIHHFNPPEDLYYKAWFPGGHIRHYADMAVEDVGFGMVQLRFIEGLNGDSIGMPNPPIHDHGNIGITGANILCQPLHQPDAEPLYITELCYYRLIPEGYEQRVTFWVGMHFKNGKSVLHLPGKKPVHPSLPSALARHSAWETATFMRNVMEFWKDSKN